MGKAIKRGPTSPQMNMTPMIDVTFQLIIFFMLVNNIIAEESVTLIVPKLWEPRTKELGDVKRITINIKPMEADRDRTKMEDAINILGEPAPGKPIKVGLMEYGFDELEAVTATLKESRDQNENVEILLRVDGGMKYEHVQPVMAAITAAKIKTVNLVAFLPEGGPVNLSPK
ncbi:MAG: biopolymer transporter ExbD [Phycisphaeraceae bacterium]